MNKAIVVISAVLASTQVFSAPLQWNYNGQAIAVGQGCNSVTGDTPINFAGNTIGMVFKNMHLQLGGPGSPLAGRRNCHIVIPTRIATGYYLAGLKQMLNYRTQKTRGSNGLIDSRARFSFQSLSTIRIQAKANDSGVLAGTINSTGGELTPADIRNWCNLSRNRPVEANLVVDVSINALRSQANQFISLSADGRWRGIGETRPCPR